MTELPFSAGHETALSEFEIETLVSICDTLIPAIEAENDTHGLFRRSASQLNIPKLLLELLKSISSPSSLLQLKLYLQALDQPLINLLWGNKPNSFSALSLEDRTALLRDWAESVIPFRRQAFFALKRMVLFLFYTVTDAVGRNPNWQAIGYPGFPGPLKTAQARAKPIKPLTFTGDTTLSTDVVIIGSGAGGGVVAGELSAAGYEVLVIEKGDYYAEADFDGDEANSQNRMFEKGGFLTSSNLSMVILAGATFGGGTTINWAASLRTPPYVTREWETEYGVNGYTGDAFEKALDAVSKRINVNTDDPEPNERNAVLVRGATGLNYEVKPIPRNVKNCDDCGFCGFGCRFGAKQSTMRTYLQDAFDRGAKIAVRTYVERILIENGKAKGVIATTYAPDGTPIRLTIKAKVVVVAAGALHTPALLLRSGLTNAHIGRNLHLHPASASIGIYATPINTWEGVMMSHVISKFNNLDGHGYGVTLESAPAHPGLTALSLAWTDGATHKALMAQYSHMANVLIITRDRDGGRVTTDARGNPVIHYKLSAHDRAHLQRGIVESLRIHKAAGAQSVYGPVAHPMLHSISTDATFEAYIQGVQKAGLRENAFVLGSAHQLSSCRMGGSPARGALRPTGESFEAKNLFVADASALPTATGVNPMLSIMGVAHVIAQQIKTRLG